MNKLKVLEEAIELRESGKLKEANAMLVKLVNNFPEDAQVNYQCAWSFDVLGLEKQAVPFYEKAISLGLPDNDLKEAYLGLGSTYRTIGSYDKSKKLLTEAIESFDSNALKVFLAMTLYNLDEHAKAMEILLKIISETSEDEDIVTFKKAIAFYSDKLEEVW